MRRVLYSTFPLMVKFLTGVLVLDLTINDFVNGPFTLASYVTLMAPVSPGLTGALVKSATEHPQVGLTSEIMIGESPLLVKVNSYDAGLLCGILPKSCVSVLKLNVPCTNDIDVNATTATNATITLLIFFILTSCFTFILFNS